MSHYETLGVGKDADAATIQRRYRYLAGQLHPDRQGGDPERMAEVNRAYAVLSDPERRARYDATGKSEHHKTADLARNILANAFETAIAEGPGPWLQRAASFLDERKLEVLAQKATTSGKRDRLRQQLGRFKVKGLAANLIDSTLETHIGNLGQQMESMTEALAVLDEARKLLADYEGPPEEPPRGSPLQFESMSNPFANANARQHDLQRQATFFQRFTGK